MKILLISPVKDISRRTVDMIRFPMISLNYIAAVTPEKHEVSIVEEEIETLDFNTDCDLVAMLYCESWSSPAW